MGWLDCTDRLRISQLPAQGIDMALAAFATRCFEQGEFNKMLEYEVRSMYEELLFGIFRVNLI